MWTRESLVELIETRFQGSRLILVSNREPYSHQYVGGTVECTRPASGMAAALDPVMRVSGGTWIAHGSGDADQNFVDAKGRVEVPPEDPRFTLRRIFLSKDQVLGYYYGLANRGLWPLCHVAYTRPAFVPEDWKRYREVNQIFADAVLEEAGDGPAIVFIQDFHFALLPRMIKERNPNLVVAQFWHIPWPTREVFRGFPWKQELLDGILGNDLLGFHLRLDCQNFLATVDHTFEARVDRERFEVTRNGKATTVRPFPISIDFAEYSAVAASPQTKRDEEHWRRELGLSEQHLVGVGVDRIDYTKGILERLGALDRLLTEYPQYRERLVFVQIGVPSRSRIREYQNLEDEIDARCDEINWRWAVRSWRPIILLKKHFPQKRLVSLHRLARFCVVTSLHDGMNLVAKEFVASRTDGDGVLVLSDFAGASRELTDAVIVNPFDEEQVSEAMRTALEMEPEERQRRMQKMRAVVAEGNIYRWIGKILSTLLRFEFVPGGQSVSENGGRVA
jgi:alpha,alpha-trehalose-phosphate synthase [UDP-forming]